MKLYELITDKDVVLDAAFKDVKLNPKKKPTLEQAMNVVASHLEKQIVLAAAALIEPAIDEMYGMYTIMNGDRADVEGDQQALDDWDSGIDDQVETAVQPYQDVLSANWLGVNTIGTALHEEDGVAKFAQSFGKEALRHFKHELTPAKLLSAAGIVEADVTARLEVAAPEPQESADGIASVVAELLPRYDELGYQAVYDDIDLIADGDEILTGAAAGRLGLTEAHVNEVQMLALTHGGDTAFEFARLMEIAKNEANKPAEKPKRQKTGDKPKTPPTVKGDELDAGLLVTLKDDLGMANQQVATAMGVSRPTVNNMVNGKSPFSPDHMQKAGLIAEIERRIAAGQAVLDTLRNGHSEVVEDWMQ